MTTIYKALLAAAILAVPAAAFAAPPQQNRDPAIAVSLGASFQPVASTTTITGDWEGEVDIPALDVNVNSYYFDWQTWSWVQHTGTTAPVLAPVSGTVDLTITNTRMELASISFAAASGKAAIASAVANRHGSTGASAGASVEDNAVLKAEIDSRWGQYTSEVSVGVKQNNNRPR